MKWRFIISPITIKMQPWDASPRTMATDKFEYRGYPWMHLFDDNTPEAFKKGLLRAKSFLDKSDSKHKVITINAWNEWTEGSYLLPDTRNGTKYLEAIRAVFGN
jgi:hypothetical protein